MSKSDFGRMLEKYGEPSVARNYLLAEALFSAAAGPAADVIDVDAFVDCYYVNDLYSSGEAQRLQMSM